MAPSGPDSLNPAESTIKARVPLCAVRYSTTSGQRAAGMAKTARIYPGQVLDVTMAGNALDLSLSGMHHIKCSRIPSGNQIGQ
jgi:hypothetical protein